MKSILILFAFLRSQNVLSPMKEKEEVVDCSDTFQGEPKCCDVETGPTMDVETPVPSDSKDSITCDGCLKFHNLTQSMEKLFFKMNLKKLCQEKEELCREEETASPKKRKRRQEDRIKEILGSIHETFKSRDPPFGKNLLMVLEIIGDIMADIGKAGLCKGGSLSNKIRSRYFYQSSFFIYNYLLDVKCCVNRYYSSGYTDLSEYRGTYEHGNRKNRLHSMSLVGRIMLALGRIDTLRCCALSSDKHWYAFPGSLFEEINGLEKGIGEVNLSIMSHFSSKECLESLSKDLKWVLLEVQEAVDCIWNHLSSKEGTLSSEGLRSLLDTASNHLNYLDEGYGLGRTFEPSFLNVKKYIDDVHSVVTEIKDCVDNMKDEKSISSCKDMKKKISDIYGVIQTLQYVIKRNISKA
jgi:hypothetical protein